MRMSEAVHPEEDAEEEPDFGLKAIKGRLPSGLSGKQERVAVAAIRNPNAGLPRISKANNVSATTALNSLKALIRGGGMERGGQANVVELRGEHRMAEGFEELTPKQAGVIDWLARRPGAERPAEEGGVPTERIATAVEESGEYPEVEAMHSTYPRKVLDRYGDLLEERREVLAARGELEDTSEEEVLATFYGKPVSRLLDMAGMAYPETNLDSLEPIEEDPMTDQERLDEAWARAQGREEAEEPVTDEDRREYTAPLSCPSCGHEEREDTCSKCGTDKRYQWAKEDAEAHEEPESAEEMTVDRILGEDGVDALNDVLTNIRERLDKQDQAIETLLSNAIMGHEFEDRAVTERDLKSYHADLEERLAEFEEHVDDRLRNSVGASLMDRMDAVETDVEQTRRSHAGELGTLQDGLKDLRETVHTLEAGTSETASLVEELEDRLATLEADVGAVRAEVDGLTEGDAETTGHGSLFEELANAREAGMDVDITLSMGGETLE